MKFAAVGDALILRHIPAAHRGVAPIRQWVEEADARFFNLETTLHREGECYGFALNGGSYLRSEPEVLMDCMRYGFNMTSFCNNHVLDYAYEGLLSTINYVSESGLVHAGVGRNLDQAAAPAYLETKNGRVALIAMTTSCNSKFDDVAIAGKQARRVPGRPGVNQMRIDTTLVVTQQQLDVIKQIAAETHYNAQEDISRAEGYRDPLPEGTFKLGKHIHFRVGEHTHQEALCNKKDLARLKKAIEEAKIQADYVLFSIHSHQVTGTAKEQPGDFLVECARFAVDCGADAVVGHGPHLLRPLELYQGKPIFYSLGDFILHNENIPYSPEDEYEGRGMTSDDTMAEVFRRRSKNFTRGLQTDARMFESVIPRWEVEGGRLVKLELLAVELGFGSPRSQNGNPTPAKDSTILERLAQISAPYGVKMHISGNVATVQLD